VQRTVVAVAVQEEVVVVVVGVARWVVEVGGVELAMAR
jgi:hypothetical protein